MNQATPTLFIFSGLPASGKSTLAQLLAQHTRSAHLRIDTIEQALRDLCSMDVQGEGYRLSYRIASDNLRLGLSVVADSCNPIALTREEWEGVAKEVGASHINIEVVCSDKSEHRRRVETRESAVPGLRLPTWAEVEAREYHTWRCGRCVIDTANKKVNESFEELIGKLRLLPIRARQIAPSGC